MLAHLNKKIAAGVLTAAAATGVLAPTPDTNSNHASGFGTVATAQAETKHKFQYISLWSLACPDSWYKGLVISNIRFLCRQAVR